MSTVLKQSIQVVVRIGPFVDVGDGFTPETAVTLTGGGDPADEAELMKAGGGASVDISARTWTGVSGCDGWYDLTLTTADTGTVGDLTVVVQNDSLHLPVHARFQVIEEAIYDSLYGASAAGFDANQRVDVGEWLGTAVTTSATTNKPQVDVDSIDDDATAADNCEAFFDGTGYAGTGNTIPTVTTTTTVTNAVTLPAIPADWITAAGIANGAIDAATFAAGAIDATAIANGAIDAATFAAGAIDNAAFNVTETLTANPAAGGIAAASFAAGAIDAAAIATGAIDADAIAADAIDLIWDEPLSGHTTGGTAGKSLSNAAGFIVSDGTCQGTGQTSTNIRLAAGESATNDIYKNDEVVITGGTGQGESALITAYDGTNKDCTVSPALVVTCDATSTYEILPAHAHAENLGADAVDTTSLADDTITAAKIAAAAITSSEAPNLDAAISTRATPAQVNTEVSDVLKTDTITLPAQGAPTNTPTMEAVLGWLYKAFRNKKTQTDTTWSLFDDAGSVVDSKATVSDSAGTFTKEEIITGP
jgi:hypothetical protein